MSCHTEEQSHTDLQDLPVFIPQEILRIDGSIGDNFFGHIGYATVVQNDGNVLIPDLLHKKLFKIDEGGRLIDIVLRQGKGPGEVEDITFLSQSAFDGILIYDQTNEKIVLLGDSGNYKDEFVLTPGLQPPGINSLSEVYELAKNQYLLIFSTWEYLFKPDSDQKSYLIVYNRSLEMSSESIETRSKLHAVLEGGGASRQIPFVPADLIGYNTSSADLYLYWSGGNDIAHLDTSLDTIRTISISLTPDRISNTEKDSLRHAFPEYWDSMKSFFSEYKAIADRMLVDPKNNFWLLLNRENDNQTWLVVSELGEFKHIVELPAGSMLTHISKHHLGVRLDDVTFALFQPLP